MMHSGTGTKLPFYALYIYPSCLFFCALYAFARADFDIGLVCVCRIADPIHSGVSATCANSLLFVTSASMLGSFSFIARLTFAFPVHSVSGISCRTLTGKSLKPQRRRRKACTWSSFEQTHILTGYCRLLGIKPNEKSLTCIILKGYAVCLSILMTSFLFFYKHFEFF